MEKGDLSTRVQVETDDEIGQLAHAFNAMAGSLSQQEQLRRNMVNDVAHELRTPLTNLRGYLDAARDGLVSTDGALVDSLYEETMLLSRLVADLQELAQAEAGRLTLMRQPVALVGLVEQAMGMLRPPALMTRSSRTASACIVAANCSGVLPTGSTPEPRNRSRTIAICRLRTAS